jgi:hypothetical protein
MTDLEKLREFAQGIFRLADWPEGGDIDGFDLQELAVRLELLETVRPTEPCGEPCACLFYYGREEFAEGGVTCYRKTPLLKGES